MSSVFDREIFWKEGKLIEESSTRIHVIKQKYLNCPCVYPDEPGAHRYGFWRDRDETGLHWQVVPVESMPTEFRAHLLLLGVTP